MSTSITDYLKVIRNNYAIGTSENASKFFKLSKLIETCKGSIAFIKRCLANNKMPNFSRLNLANNELRHNKSFYNRIRASVTEEELSFKNNRLRKLLKEREQCQIALDLGDNKLDQADMNLLLEITKAKEEQIRRSDNERYTKQLAALGIEIPIDSKFVNKNRRGLNKKEDVEMAEPIFNLSSRTFNEVEIGILNKGLRFGICTKKVNRFEILARFEECALSFNNLEINEKEDTMRASLNTKSAFNKGLSDKMDEYMQLTRRPDDNLSVDEREAIVELAKDKTIVISKADKGNAVVVQNIDDYKKKVLELLSTEKFKKLDKNPTRIRENRLQVYLRTFHPKEESKRRIPDAVYKKILPSGSRAGVLYGLPKVHKKGSPLRPIISAVKTYNYELAKYLDGILKPLVNSKYMLNDTYDFVNKVSLLDVEKNKYMVSFDVESLFTNVPTTETIEIILDLAFDGNHVFHGFKRDELQRLLTICTQESHFQFDGNYYDQVDGVAMGSPLGPLFANVFMANFENKHMDKLNELGIVQWWRYVDDVFATMESAKESNTILEYLNAQHPNIRFTIEHETKDKIPFLDTSVVRRNDRYNTTIYRKKTFTGVYLNWNSLTARRYKIGLIGCLAERIWRIVSDKEERLDEIGKLKTILQRNDYPEEVIDQTINKFIEKKLKDDSRQAEQCAIITRKEEKTHKRFLVLPYVGKKCEDFAYRLKHFVESYYPQVDFNVAFQAPMSIGKMFPFKDNIRNVEERSMVVYRLKCKACEADYIGKTERLLHYRINEHVRVGSSSACRQHMDENPGHLIDTEMTEILDTADTFIKLSVKELLHIHNRKPKLNVQSGPNSDYEIKTLLVKVYPQFKKNVNKE